MFQLPGAEMIRNEVGMAVRCVGSITTGDQVNTIIPAGRADLLALARSHLTDPAFTLHAAAGYGVRDVTTPVQYPPVRWRSSATRSARARR
jgi:anthraniloyl-CoA monooxygenase